MSSNKRRSENAQVRKEDYEDVGSTDTPVGPFARASQEDLKSRKLIRVRYVKPKASSLPAVPKTCINTNCSLSLYTWTVTVPPR